MRAQHGERRRSDRLHTGPARAGEETARTLHVAAGRRLHAARRRQHERHPGAINIGHVNGGSTEPGGGYDRARTVFVHANTSSIQSVRSPRPPGFSCSLPDGVSGSSSGCARRQARDIRRCAAAERRRAAVRPRRRWRRRGARRRVDGSGAVDRETTLQRPAAIDLDKESSHGACRTAKRRTSCAITRCSRG